MTTISKKQNLLTKFFPKNKSFESTGLPDATSQEVSIKNADEDSKAETQSVNSKMSGSRKFSWLVNDSSYDDVMYCDFYRKAGLDM